MGYREAGSETYQLQDTLSVLQLGVCQTWHPTHSPPLDQGLTPLLRPHSEKKPKRQICSLTLQVGHWSNLQCPVMLSIEPTRQQH